MTWPDVIDDFIWTWGAVSIVWAVVTYLVVRQITDRDDDYRSADSHRRDDWDEIPPFVGEKLSN